MSDSFFSNCTQTSDCSSGTYCELDVVYQNELLGVTGSNSVKAENERYKNFDNKMNIHMKEEICCICRSENLLVKCSLEYCNKQFHISCLQSYFTSPHDNTLVCPVHMHNKILPSVSKLLHLSNNFNSNPLLQTTLTTEKTPKSQDLRGKLFWFGISQQYFPCHPITLPVFNQSSPHIMASPTSWLEEQMALTSNELLSVSTSLSSDFSSILPQASASKPSKPPKPLERISSVLSIPQKAKNILIRNHEKLQLASFRTETKDYHGFISDDKIVCAICDDGESTDENLIVICSACNLPVHCKCYSIPSLPETDWHCEYCKGAVNWAEPKDRECFLCSVKGGALRAMSNGEWAHFTCFKYLADPSGRVNSEKFKLKCYFCGIKTGACIQCAHGRCAIAFHVECRKDLIDKSAETTYALCPTHKANKLTKYIKESEDSAFEMISRIAEQIIQKPENGSKVEKADKQEAKKSKKSEPELRIKKIKAKVDKIIQIQELKNIFLNISEDKIVLKVFVNEKLTKLLKYVSRDFKKKVKGTKTKIEKMPCKLERHKDSEFSVVSGSEGEFSIKVKLPSNLFQDSPRKIQKCGE